MLGYKKPLYILPFDHRANFMKFFGMSEPLTASQVGKLKKYKKIIFRGFYHVYKQSPHPDYLGILIDEHLGMGIIKSAKRKKILLALPAEKSGEKVFQFIHGEDFSKPLDRLRPNFAKALVWYNPADKKNNVIAKEKLKQLSDFCRASGLKLIIELLVGATKEQLEAVKNKPERFDAEIRPALMVGAIKELQDHGIEPDIWKIEAVSKKDDWQKIIAQVQNNAERSEVKIIVLGRGEDKKKVLAWLRLAAKFPAIIGFAVGRTVFANPLVRYHKRQIDKKQAINTIANNFLSLIKLWEKSRISSKRKTQSSKF